MNLITQHTSIEGGQNNTLQNIIVGGVEKIMQKFPSETIAQLPEQVENMGVLLRELEKAVETRSKEVNYDYGDYKNRLCQSDEVFERTLEEVLRMPQIGELYKRIIEAFPEDSRDVARQKITKEYLEDLVFEGMKVEQIREIYERPKLQNSNNREENLQGYLRQIEELKGSGVRGLNLAEHKLGEYLGVDEIVRLAEALKGSGVRSVSLGHNQLGKYLGVDGIVRLVEVLRGSGVRSLDLRNNSLGDYLGADGMVKLVGTLNGSGVRGLGLGSNGLLLFGIDGIMELAKALKGSGVRNLDLRDNESGMGFGADGIIGFAKALKGGGIKRLNVEGNWLCKYLGVNGIIQFAEALEGSGVRSLDLSWNDLGEYLGMDEMVKLVETLRGSGVRGLNLWDSTFSDEVGERLKEQFPDMYFSYF